MATEARDPNAQDEQTAPASPGNQPTEEQQAEAQPSAPDTSTTGEAGEQSSGSPEAQGDTEKPKRKRRRGGDPGALRAHLRATERQLEAERQKRLELEAKLAESQDPEPSREQFDDPEEFGREQERWRQRQEARGRESTQQRPGPADDQVAALEQHGVLHHDAVEMMQSVHDARSAHADWEQRMRVVGGQLGNAELLRALAETDDPGELLYQLASDPNEFQRIASLTSETAIARELGKVETFLELQAKQQQAEVISGNNLPSSPGTVLTGGSPGLTDTSAMSREDRKRFWAANTRPGRWGKAAS